MEPNSQESQKPSDDYISILPSSHDLWSKTVHNVLTNLRTYILIIVWPFVASIPLLILSVLSSDQHAARGGAILAKIPEFWLNSITIVLSLLLFVVWTASETALLAYVCSHNKTPSAAHNYRLGARYILPWLGVAILNGIIILGGLMVLIIPGIIFYTFLIFTFFTLFTEEARGFKALRRSRELVQGLFSPIFLRLLVILFVFIVFLGVGALVVEGVIFITGLMIELDPIIVSIIREVGGQLVTVLVSPLWAVWLFYLYLAVKAQKNTSAGPIISQPPLLRSLAIVALIGWLLLIFAYVPFIIKVSDSLDRNEKVKNVDLLTIQVPLRQYHQANQRFPDRLGDLVPGYVQQLPSLFTHPDQYTYILENNAQRFTICSLAEEPDECVSGE